MTMQLQIIENKIYVLRSKQIMLDFDLAVMYGIETRRLKEQVKRNIERFPNDFMFQLTKNEWQELVAICDNLPENIKFSPALPYAFYSRRCCNAFGSVTFTCCSTGKYRDNESFC